ncbi:hypothetical protein [Gimesia sp.]|uniref:hypothetical protein n=1 Tax=Gimesia sp. TaxID=2024833 RepID=UPI003A90F557
MLRLKKTWLILASMLAVVIYFQGDRNDLLGIMHDQWDIPQPANQSSLIENDLQELHRILKEKENQNKDSKPYYHIPPSFYDVPICGPSRSTQVLKNQVTVGNEIEFLKRFLQHSTKQECANVTP